MIAGKYPSGVLSRKLGPTRVPNGDLDPSVADVVIVIYTVELGDDIGLRPEDHRPRIFVDLHRTRVAARPKENKTTAIVRA